MTGDGVDLTLTIERTGGASPWLCRVDGAERSCWVGHGILAISVEDGFPTPTVWIDLLECVGRETAATYADAGEGQRVMLRRLAC